MTNDIDFLSNFSLFENIDASDLPAMLRCLGAYRKTYRKDSFILHAGDAMDWIGFVLSGCVQMVKEDYDGSCSIFAEMGEGDLFGENFACASIPLCSVSFRAAEHSAVYVLPFQKVLRVCSLKCVFHHKLIENMVNLLARGNVQLTDKIEVISKKSIRRRLLTYLFQLSQAQRTERVVVPLNRTGLAEYLFVDRSALSREIHNLVEEQLLHVEKNTFSLRLKST